MVNSISITELIRRIAGKCGVPDSEAKVFFEIFLLLISNKMVPGDYLFIDGVGYFHLKKAVIRGPAVTGPPKEIIILLFSTELIESPSSKDHLILNIPMVDEEDIFRTPDYHFSLSIGKPVIPLKSAKYSEFILPPSGPELRHLLYSKAERLFNDSDMTKKGEAETIPVIIPFGGKHSSIQKDALSESLTGLEDEAKPESIKISPDSLADEISSPEKIPEAKQTGDSELIQPKYERVKSVKIETPKSEIKAESKGDFTEEFTSSKSVLPKEQERRKEKSSARVKNIGDRSIISQRIKQAEEDKSREVSYRRRRFRAAIILLAALLVLSVAGALIYYSPLFRSEDINKSIIAHTYQIQPVIIERSYEIPVTYPYDGSISISGFTFNPIALLKQQKIQETAQNPPLEVKQEKVSELSAVTPVKLKDNIFSYNDIIVVQVSSWKSLNKAKSEVEKYNAAGYKAFLDDSNIQEKGTYYRVRVGNFKSLGEAEQFLRKNF